MLKDIATISANNDSEIGEIIAKAYNEVGKDGIVTVFLSGACSGCAMSTQTLKMGIENMLKYYIPEVLAVEGIEDPNSTVNPYYQ